MIRAENRLPSGELAPFIEQLQGKKTGVTAGGEELTVVGQARRFLLCQPDPSAKTLLSLLLAGL